MSFDFSRLIPFMTKLLFSLGFMGVLVLISTLISKRVKHSLYNSDLEGSAYSQRFAEMMSDVTYRGMITFTVMVFFQMMGIDIGFLITWLTFGIGFAIKEILGNMFAWIMILTNKKFTIGDIVQFEWGLNYFGSIKEINIRHTIIQTFDHRRVIVPNIVLVSNFVKTYSAEEIIKVSVEIDLGFQDDPTVVCEGIKEYLNQKDFIVQKEATKVLVSSIFDSGYNLKLFFYMKPKWKKWLLVAKSLIQKELLLLYDQKWWHYPWDHIAITTDAGDLELIWAIKAVCAA